MSAEIDMESYAGAMEPAAGVQQVVDTNSYAQEAHDAPLVDIPVQAEEPSKQELNFRALAGEVDRMKAERDAERREYQLQLDLLKANLERQSQPAAPQQTQERRMFEGMKEDDIPNVGELRKEWEAKEAGYQARLEELQVAQMHPDYAEVIEKYALPLVKQKPHLAEGIQGSRNKALFAYELGKMAQQMQSTAAAPQPAINESAQRMLDNSRKPGTLSQAGGQGALSKADYFANMSDSEFIKFASRNLEGI